jgi:NAD(P)-dependent dehydrogenase (short-subunit alcohol dehydrogenase family)
MAFSEEVAWVTGSSTGIGRAVAVTLAGQGRRVVVHYNASEDEAWESDSTCISCAREPAARLRSG